MPDFLVVSNPPSKLYLKAKKHGHGHGTQTRHDTDTPTWHFSKK